MVSWKKQGVIRAIPTPEGLDQAVKESWEELDELCDDLPSSDLFDDSETETEPADFVDGSTWWQPVPVEDAEEGLVGDIECFPGERYVYGRTIAALSARIARYVEARDLNKVQELWAQLSDHALYVPGAISSSLMSRVTELLDGLGDLTPVLIYEPSQVEVPKIDLEVSQYLVDRIVRHPELLREISPRRFEELIKEIFGAFGYLVELTARTRDGGRDIIAIRNDHSIMVKYLIECKRFSSERRVGVSYVRQLYGVKIHEGATKAVLATTSYFTKPAREMEAQHLWELELKDYDAIVGWARSYWKLLRKTKGERHGL